MNQKLTCHKARQIDLCQLILTKGGRLHKENETKATFYSPFRNERTPSFTVCKIRNRWKDWGIDKGGSTIDFIIELNQCSTSEALEILNNNFSSFPRQKIIAPKEEKKEAFTIIKITDLNNKILNKYIAERCIDFEVAKRYLKVLYYTHKNRQFFTLGFRNDSGHYEARNAIFKTCIGKKDITSFIKGKGVVKLFEGQYDFMSYETIFGLEESDGYIVLNSVSMLDKVLPRLAQFNSIEIYFDNDDSGKKATERVIESYPAAENCNSLYKGYGYGDLNEYLIAIRNK